MQVQPSSASPAPTNVTEQADLAARFSRVRSRTMDLASGIGPEWGLVQVAVEGSPTKWHMAHSTWFFERFCLRQHHDSYQAFPIDADGLFNSYYHTVGEQWPRGQRGWLASPSWDEVIGYRHHVDAALGDWLAGERLDATVRDLVVLGLAHEEQHQELLVTDQLLARRSHPQHPAWLPAPDAAPPAPITALGWLPIPEGIVAIGHDGDDFAFDNEGPRHEVLLHGGALADRLVTNDEYESFIESGAYDDPIWWTDAGWQAMQEVGYRAPAGWFRRDGLWWTVTAHGAAPLVAAEPVIHVSWYEADAYARWCGCRLPLEAEWEAVAADAAGAVGRSLEDGNLHPGVAQAAGESRMAQAFGDAWEWTASQYRPYPGYRPAAGAVGEYNGKFMCNQFVLRGSSCATPRDHSRLTYRNFFDPGSRWQFTGIRLAKDLA